MASSSLAATPELASALRRAISHMSVFDAG